MFAALALAAAASSACRSESSAGIPAGQETEPRKVRVVPVRREILPRAVSVTGTLAAQEQAELGLKVPGRVAEMMVDLGSRASKGQPLARLVSTDYELRVRQAEAGLQQARARLGLTGNDAEERIDPEATPLVRQTRAVVQEASLARDRARRLFEENLIARSELDAAEAEFQVAEGRHQDAREEILNRQGVLAQRKSELDLARQQLADTVLRAPFDGGVSERHVALGQYVSAGESVVTLVRIDPLRLRLAVPERESAGLSAGQEVTLTVEGDTATYTGRLARLSPAIDAASRTLMVEAEVPNAGGALRPGSFATASIVVETGSPVLLVPANSLVSFAGIEKVLLVKDGAAVEQRVTTGRRTGSDVEIEEGVREGDQVVIEPGNLAGGESVEVVR